MRVWFEEVDTRVSDYASMRVRCAASTSCVGSGLRLMNVDDIYFMGHSVLCPAMHVRLLM